MKKIGLIILLLVSLVSQAQDFEDTETKTKTENKDLIACSAGITLLDSNKIEMAIKEFNKVIFNNPNNIYAHEKLGEIYLTLQKNRKAKKHIWKALEIDITNIEGLSLKIRYLIQVQSYQDAKKILDTLIISQNKNYYLLYIRAQFLAHEKKYKEAVSFCDKALVGNPDFIDALILRSKIKVELLEPISAFKTVSKAIEVMKGKKNNLEAYKIRARIQYDMGQYELAIKDWDVCIKKNPLIEESRLARALCNIALNKMEAAIKDLDTTIILNKKNYNAFNYRGVAKSAINKDKEAMQDYNQSIKLNKSNASAYINRAALKHATKDAKGGCDDLLRAEKFNNTKAVDLYNIHCR